MNYVTARELAKGSKKIWEDLEEKNELIITNNGKPTALMLNIKEDSSPEVLLKAIRQAETMIAVNRMRMIAADNGYMADDEIEAEIQAVRKEAEC